MAEKKCKKSSRFSETMNEVLIEHYEKNQIILKSKFSNFITNEKKKQVWKNITDAVNAVNSSERKTIEQVKKRWEDITTSVKRKERNARQGEIKRLRVTGNGNLPDEQNFSDYLNNPVPQASEFMSSSEKQVAGILGPEVFVGILGGIDSLDSILTNMENSDGEVPYVGEDIGTMRRACTSQSPQMLPHVKPNELADSQDLDMSENMQVPLIKKRKRKSLAEAQLAYFEAATEYFILKTKKVKLEIESMKSSKEA